MVSPCERAEERVHRVCMPIGDSLLWRRPLGGHRGRSDFKGRRFEETFEIKIRNHKESEATVNIVEHLYRWTNWKIVESSTKWVKKDAQTVEFPVTVKKDGEAVVTYTVKYSW